MKYLITGGSGFIGSNIARFLLEQGDEVRVLDSLATGRKENLDEIRDRIEYIDGDIRDFWTAIEAVDGVDYVLHQAALPSVPRSVENPQTSNAVNTDGTLNMLEASKRAGVKKFVMASSSSVYGESEELPKHEKMIPSPLSPYAVNKLTGEYFCKVYWNLYQMPTVCLRYFNIFGPYQDPTSQYSAVIPLFITALKNGRKPVIFGDGEQSRDFTYIENAVRANILAATNDKMVGDNFNVACGAQFTLNDLVRKLGEILGIKAAAQYADPRPGDIMHSYADIEKIKSFGFVPTVDFDEGLRRTVDYYD